MRPGHCACIVAVLSCAGCGLAPAREPPAREVSGAPDQTVAGAPKPTPTSPSPSPSTPPSAEPLTPPLPGYQLVWHDEFDGTSVDTTRWNVEVGPRHDATNGPDALSVHDGLLNFTTYTDAAGHHTGFLDTVGKFAARYGYFEARVRLGTRAGEWCSWWNISPTYGNPIGDPGLAGTEIDIFEHRFTDNLGFVIKDMIQVGVNYDGFGAQWKRDYRTLALPSGAPLWGEWHTYAALWDESGYTFYVDEQPIWASTNAVSNQAHAVYLTCEVDVNNWAGQPPDGGYAAPGASPPDMEVDWARVWQKAP